MCVPVTLRAIHAAARQSAPIRHSLGTWLGFSETEERHCPCRSGQRLSQGEREAVAVWVTVTVSFQLQKSSHKLCHLRALAGSAAEGGSSEGHFSLRLRTLSAATAGDGGSTTTAWGVRTVAATGIAALLNTSACERNRM
jgi:hypothetical protein